MKYFYGILTIVFFIFATLVLFEVLDPSNLRMVEVLALLALATGNCAMAHIYGKK